MIEEIKTIGFITVFIMLGISGVVILFYVKSIMIKLDTLPDMVALCKKVDELVHEVQLIFTNQKINEITSKNELSLTKDRIDKLEKAVNCNIAKFTKQ